MIGFKKQKKKESNILDLILDCILIMIIIENTKLDCINSYRPVFFAINT